RLVGAGMDLKEFPLFVILGQPAEQEEYLFASAGLSLKVKEPRTGKATPVHVFATADAIFVTCPNASVLSRQAAWLVGKSPKADSESSPDAPEPGMSPDLNTLMPSQDESPALEMQDVLISAEREGRTLAALTPVEKRELRRLSRLSNAGRATRLTAETLDEQ